jgi:hypothetical protein
LGLQQLTQQGGVGGGGCGRGGGMEGEGVFKLAGGDFCGSFQLESGSEPLRAGGERRVLRASAAREE